jgi:hypothetical protein
MALLREAMSAPRKPQPEALDEPLAARVEDIEVRVTVLEAKVRDVSQKIPEGAPVVRTKPRARCPGCFLELPPGKRGDKCVWCGFVFDAVRGRATK